MAVNLDGSAAGLATLYAEIGRQLAVYDKTTDALAAVAQTSVIRVPGAEWASVTKGSRGSFETVASTHPAALTADEIQYELGSGPCVDAILQETVFRTGDVAADPRWEEFGRRATGIGVRSMLSYRLFLEDDDLIAGLNLYATRKDAFDDSSQTIGILLATHGALAVSAASARERVAQLQQALTSNRDIGVAMGVLMIQHKITRRQAFDLLRVASQNSNRKLAEIAIEVGDTGALDLPGRTPADGWWTGPIPPPASPPRRASAPREARPGGKR
jgi:GAF domain-containing protein